MSATETRSSRRANTFDRIEVAMDDAGRRAAARKRVRMIERLQYAYT